MRYVAVVCLALLVLIGCAEEVPKTLKGTFEKQMKDDGVTGYTVLRIQEDVSDGIVMFTQGSRTSLGYFTKVDGGWKQQTGSVCGDNGVSKVGLMGNGYAYCAALKKGMDFAVVRVGDAEVELTDTKEGTQAWFLRADSGELDVVGVTKDGKEVKLN